MSAFSLALIAGVPLALLLAEWSGFGWRAPFVLLTIVSSVVLLLACYALPSLAGHLTTWHEPARIWDVVSRGAHLRAYALMLSLVFSSNMVFPYIAAFLVKNVGRKETELPLVYVFGGMATLVSLNLVGRLSDRFPRTIIFRILALAAIGAVLLLTWLPAGTSLAATLALTTALMVLTSGRMVPAMALITSAAAPQVRGSFMSINASVQQLGAGLGPLLGGLLLRDDGPGTALEGYPVVGLVAAAAGLASVALVGLLQPDGETALPMLAERAV